LTAIATLSSFELIARPLCAAASSSTVKRTRLSRTTK
jgi:hypothetical protein